MIVLSFIICTIIILFLLNIDNKKKSTIFLCSILFATQVFFWIPKNTSYVDTMGYFFDISQIRIYLENGGFLNAWQYVKYNTSFNSAPLMGILLLFCAILGNSGILLFITAFVDVLFVLLFLNLVSHKNKIEFLYSVVAFICLFNFSAAIGGIRNDMVAIIGCYVFVQRINRKINVFETYLLLILISLLHPIGLIFILINLILDIFYNHKLIMSFVYIFLILQKYIQPIIFKLLSFFSSVPYIQSILNKSTQYFGDNATITLADSTFIKSLVRYAFVVFVFLICFLIKKNYFSRKYNQLCILFICFAFGSLSDSVLFGRIMKVLIILILPYIGKMLNVNVKKYTGLKKSFILLTMLIVISFGIFSLADNLRAINTYYELEITKYL